MWDAIVIGSGIGGLSAAGLLAGVDNRRVLVLEKLMAPGGLMQAFRRDGACWDVGLHYVGQMEEGSLARRLFDFLSGGALRWQRMPDEFERFVYSGLDFRVPSDPQQFEDRLIERFPQKKAAIRQYFRDVRRVQRWCTLGFTRAFVPLPAGPLIGLAQRPGRRRALQTTGDYLQRHFRSPMLRALLASQWPDYGLSPAKSAFAIHAQIVAHYLHGAWFPEGGSNRVVRTLEKGIERHGGEVCVFDILPGLKGGDSCGAQARHPAAPGSLRWVPAAGDMTASLTSQANRACPALKTSIAPTTSAFSSKAHATHTDLACVCRLCADTCPQHGQLRRVLCAGTATSQPPFHASL